MGSVASFAMSFTAKTSGFEQGIDRMRNKVKQFHRDARAARGVAEPGGPGMFGKSSAFGAVGGLLRGGGIVAGIGLAVSGVDRMVVAMQKIDTRSIAATRGFAGLVQEFVKSIPIIGTVGRWLSEIVEPAGPGNRAADQALFSKMGIGGKTQSMGREVAMLGITGSRKGIYRRAAGEEELATGFAKERATAGYAYKDELERIKNERIKIWEETKTSAGFLLADEKLRDQNVYARELYLAAIKKIDKEEIDARRKLINARNVAANEERAAEEESRLGRFYIESFNARQGLKTFGMTPIQKLAFESTQAGMNPASQQAMLQDFGKLADLQMWDKRRTDAQARLAAMSPTTYNVPASGAGGAASRGSIEAFRATHRELNETIEIKKYTKAQLVELGEIKAIIREAVQKTTPPSLVTIGP